MKSYKKHFKINHPVSSNKKTLYYYNITFIITDCARRRLKRVYIVLQRL